ncbi:protein FAM131C [Liasis olivaceus]
MGSCVSREFLTSAHKEGGTAPLPDQPAAAPQEGGNPPVAPLKEGNNEKSFQDASSATSGANAGSLRAYHVTALATSSLLGLIQTIKDHITKPTAMAQGRVAHLIEWKGWSAPPMGWGQPPHEEALYEELTDELKEARFAAGVAKQFAITEATLSAWSSLGEELSYRGGSQDAIQLQDLEGLYLQENFLFCSPALAGSLQTFSPSAHGSPIAERPLRANDWNTAKGGLGRGEAEQVGLPNSLGLQQSATSLHYVDSSSPSEDEVFYD